IEKQDIDRAIALSLSEEDHKGKKVVGSQALFVALNQLCLFISANFSVLKALGLLSF
ncbi:hypothetical protein D0Y65_015676, partial [Glycine soja]